MAAMSKKLPHYTPEFEMFWKSYPRRRPNPKPEAQDAFLAAIALKDPRATPETLVAAATRFAEECRRESVDPVFIPHARTWLNKRRFLDYLAEPAREGLDSSLPSSGSTRGPTRPLAGDPRLHPLAEHMGRTTYDTWIAPLEITEHPPVKPGGRGLVRVIAPNPTHRDWVRNHYGDALRRVLGHPPEYTVRPYNRSGRS